MEGEREMPVYPIYFTAVTVDDSFSGRVETLAIRAFEIRVFDQRHGRIEVPVDMIAFGINRPHIFRFFLGAGLRTGLRVRLRGWRHQTRVAQWPADGGPLYAQFVGRNAGRGQAATWSTVLQLTPQD